MFVPMMRSCIVAPCAKCHPHSIPLLISWLQTCHLAALFLFFFLKEQIFFLQSPDSEVSNAKPKTEAGGLMGYTVSSQYIKGVSPFFTRAEVWASFLTICLSFSMFQLFFGHDPKWG